MFDVYKLLARKYPDGLEMENGDGFTPHNLAQKQNLNPNIVEFLNPFEEVEEWDVNVSSRSRFVFRALTSSKFNFS